MAPVGGGGDHDEGGMVGGRGLQDGGCGDRSGGRMVVVVAAAMVDKKGWVWCVGGSGGQRVAGGAVIMVEEG